MRKRGDSPTGRRMLRRLCRWHCAPTIAPETFVVMVALAGRWAVRLEGRCLPL